MRKAKKRVATTLNAAEQRDFAKVRKFVHAHSGLRSNAEVLRFLVRNWTGQ